MRLTKGLCLAGLLLWPAAAWPRPAPPAAPLQLHPERVSKNMLAATTRGGQLVVKQDAAGWRVVLGSRTVLDGVPLGAVRLRLDTIAAGRQADLAIVIVNAGTGCPVRFAVINVTATGRAVAGQPFGSCADLLAVGVDGNALVFTMPEHPGGTGGTRVQFRFAAGAVSGPVPAPVPSVADGPPATGTER